MVAPPSDQDARPVRTKPRPGERRLAVLQALAQLLEQPGAERVTTAQLARQLGVSEAALYRHFASKAQMFEGLMDFIEHSVFSLVQQVTAQLDAGNGAQAGARIVTLVAQFAEANPGMARVLVGDALVLEHPRLQERVERFFDKIAAQLRQCLRLSAAEAPAEAGAEGALAQQAGLCAALLVDLLRGRLQRFVRSQFRELPTRQLPQTLALVL